MTFVKLNDTEVIFSMNPFEKAVYTALLSFADWKTYKCFPSLPTIAKKAKVCRNTVIKYIKILEEKGCIIRQNRTVKGKLEKTSNLYIVNPNPSLSATHGLPSTQDGLKQELINYNDVDIEKADKKEMDVESIKKELDKKYSPRAVTLGLQKLRQALNNNQTIYNIIQYVDKICKNFEIGFKLTESVKEESPITTTYTTPATSNNVNKGLHSNKTYNSNSTSYKKTKFHNFPERFANYSNDELEKMVLEKQKLKFGTGK